MKKWKKNLISAGILVTVCCGIYVNWAANGGADTQNLEDALNSDKIMSDDLLVMGDDFQENVNNTITDYFAAVRLSRQEARDNAVTLLQEAMSYADEAANSETTAQLQEIVQTALCEAQIESLIIAKGYSDCVAYINENGIQKQLCNKECQEINNSREVWRGGSPSILNPQQRHARCGVIRARKLSQWLNFSE